jgi:hypothetical protein
MRPGTLVDDLPGCSPPERACDSQETERLLPGAVVEVRPWEQIAGTLDENGMLESLPFMPEMLQYCGQRFTVSKRLERTCEETEGSMRRIRGAVFLGDLRCDGLAHGGCQKGCRIFWKESWLRPVNSCADSGSLEPSVSLRRCSSKAREQFVCQSTELIRATSPIPPWDLGMYVRDLRARTYSISQLLRVLCFALFLRLRHLVTGKSYRFVEGDQDKTPRVQLDLHPGEFVRVRSKQEIVSTLDKQGKNRGLAFTVDMLPFCGREFRVLRRLEKMIQEPTQKLIRMENTVILDEVTCKGCHILRGGCPRDNFHFWREAWLERVSTETRLP